MTAFPHQGDDYSSHLLMSLGHMTDRPIWEETIVCIVLASLELSGINLKFYSFDQDEVFFLLKKVFKVNVLGKKVTVLCA